jgi:PHS family inorganic phosphate transporter-like MFS transporter
MGLLFASHTKQAEMYSNCLAAALVALIVTAAYKNSILNSSSVNDLRAVDYMWRILIGFGCVPAVISLYQQRFIIPETPRFSVDVARNVDQAEVDVGFVKTGKKARIDSDTPIERVDVPKASWDDFVRYLGQGRNLRILLAMSYSWFAFQVSCQNFACLLINPEQRP